MELLLLSQFNLDSPLPTVFELLARDSLADSLHGALKFALTSLATHIPRLAPVVHWYDELFLAFDGAVQHLFLTTIGATMAEYAFGLRRSAVLPRQASSLSPNQQQQQQQPSSSSGDVVASTGGGGNDEGLGAKAELPKALAAIRLEAPSRLQRILSLLLTVVLSYIRRRLGAYTTFLRSTKAEDEEERRRIEQRQPWRAPVNRAIALTYPYVHAVMELSNVAFMLGYMADKTPYFSWQQWACGCTVRRATRTDMMQVASSPAAQRAVNFAQISLMGIAVAFRLLDWWNTADGREAGTSLTQEALPPPPPPPLTRTIRDVDGRRHDDVDDEANEREGGTGRRPNAGECGVCRRQFVNPAVNTASGYVFCYPCLHQAVGADGRCPVSGVPSSLGHIRRLFNST